MPRSESDEVSYCALYCGNCFIRISKLADQAQSLLAEFNRVGFSKWASGLASLSEEVKAFEKHEACCDVLKAWDAMRCTRSCKDGGGSSACKIRDCCRGKALAGCWECPEYQECETLAGLQPVSGNLNLDHIRKIRGGGLDAFIAEAKKRPDGEIYS